MEPYLFQGIVLPERAQLSFQFSLGFSHISTGIEGQARVNIILNQACVWVDSEHNWDIFDLRNLVKTIVQNELATLGYLKGYAYDFQINRVINQSRGIDYVFGIGIPCIEERGSSFDLEAALRRIREKTIGPNGTFLHRCFNDLISSMKHADDTAFYCYRAIESLRHHCAALHNLTTKDRNSQWEQFRQISGCDEQAIRTIKTAADPVRHGGASPMTSEERTQLFTSTWDIVDAYLKGLEVDPK